MAQEVQNKMKEIRLEKVVLNMGLGKSGDAVEIAKKALGQISNKKVNDRPAKKAIRDWGVRKGEPIGAAVTIRGNDGKELLKRLLEAKGNKVNGRSFDKLGNLSFGILEHIDIPGIKYDPKIGILGLNVTVRLVRPGFSISMRSKHKASVGKNHRIKPDEAKAYLTKEFGASVE
ncbi:MAG: 50S ribosomal protein L5 [Crenarchaeota archaeon]|nr:50S ribosomal protein L5 [Thermoproteota archaeon]MDA1124340.1 50S ribosomal protein L5 [Thermoproteota archaeon]